MKCGRQMFTARLEAMSNAEKNQPAIDCQVKTECSRNS
jgi:hypothetical protein